MSVFRAHTGGRVHTICSKQGGQELRSDFLWREDLVKILLLQRLGIDNLTKRTDAEETW